MNWPASRVARPEAGDLRFPARLLAVFLVLAAGLGWRPVSRPDWLLENAIVAVAVPLLAWGATRLRISRLSYGAVFIFFCLHEIGAHYTYSLVPYDAASQAVLGRGLNEVLGWDRNHYDRLVHFLYGFLLMPYTLELFAQRAPPRGLWRFVFPVFFLMGHSALYELIEWAAAVVFGGQLGQEFLGTQGDVWDAQKDTALATAGAVVSAVVLLTFRGFPEAPPAAPPAGGRGAR
ncbi:MAG: DUF2238 domain-containing protein [Verrucomicrobiota bacterium]